MAAPAAGFGVPKGGALGANIYILDRTVQRECQRWFCSGNEGAVAKQVTLPARRPRHVRSSQQKMAIDLAFPRKTKPRGKWSSTHHHSFGNFLVLCYIVGF